MTLSHKTLHLSGPDDTTELAQKLAGRLNEGDTILLSGEMGAGKSHFARSFILARLEVPEDIPSPTFTLVQTYVTDHAEIWHADLYRLAGPSEIEELGLLDAFETALCLIEWPERLEELRPQNALSLTLNSPHNDEQRIARLEWTHPKWAKMLKDIG